MVKYDNKRKLGYDLIKTVAIVFIVIYHMGGVNFGSITDTGYNININKILQVIVSAAVPLFLMINGALVAEKTWSAQKFVTKGVKWLFLAYFWMFFFYFFVYPLLGFELMQDIHILLTPRMHRIYWFLFNLGIIYIVHPFIRKRKVFVILLMVVLLLFPFLSNIVWDVILYRDPKIIAPSWSHFGLYGLYTFFFFYLGDILKNKNLSRMAIPVLFIGGWLLCIFDVIVHSNNLHRVFDGVNALFPTIGALLLSVSLFFAFKDADIDNLTIRKYIEFIGRNTMGIYVFHMFFILALRQVLPPVIPSIYAIIISLCIVNITAVISHLICKSKLKFLFGS